MEIVFEQMRLGGDRNFGYLLGDPQTQEAVLIDPAYLPEKLVERARAQSLKITHILNTHGHVDHTNGNDTARKLTGAPLAAHEDAPDSPDVVLVEGSRLQVGGITLTFFHTPGHAADHLVIFAPEQELALTGDLIFVGKVGGTGNREQAVQEWDSLQRVLSEVPDTTTLWPGHDYGCRPATTLALEKKGNPFLRCTTLEDFLDLKQNWASFKSRHGLL